MLWSVPGSLAACALAVWLSSRMRTEPLPDLPPPALERCWIDARLGFLEGSEGFAFRLSGTTRLPAETVLRARVHALEEVIDPRQGRPREDEEPLVWDDDGSNPPFRRFRAGYGPFEFEVCRFRRRPYSLRYRARISYRPEDQEPEVRELLGEEEFSITADTRLGGEPAFLSELQSRRAEAEEDLKRLEEIWREVRRETARQEEARDPESWHAWTEIWRPRLEAFSTRNRERFELWCVWPERRAKMRLGGIAELLRRLLEAQTGPLADDPDRAGRARELRAAIPEYLAETDDEIDLGGRLDPEVFGPLLARYDRALGGLPATRGDALAALLSCAPPLHHRRRAYASLNDVGFGLARLLEAPGPGTRAAHDRALASFKSLAGLE